MTTSTDPGVGIDFVDITLVPISSGYGASAQVLSVTLNHGMVVSEIAAEPESMAALSTASGASGPPPGPGPAVSKHELAQPKQPATTSEYAGLILLPASEIQVGSFIVGTHPGVLTTTSATNISGDMGVFRVTSTERRRRGEQHTLVTRAGTILASNMLVSTMCDNVVQLRAGSPLSEVLVDWRADHPFPNSATPPTSSGALSHA